MHPGFSACEERKIVSGLVGSLVCCHLMLSKLQPQQLSNSRMKIMSNQYHQLRDLYIIYTLEIWSKSGYTSKHVYPADKIQKVWNAAIASAVCLPTCSATKTDTAKLLAVSSPHSGNHLQVHPSLP